MQLIQPIESILFKSVYYSIYFSNPLRSARKKLGVIRYMQPSQILGKPFVTIQGQWDLGYGNSKQIDHFQTCVGIALESIICLIVSISKGSIVKTFESLTGQNIVFSFQSLNTKQSNSHNQDIENNIKVKIHKIQMKSQVSKSSMYVLDLYQICIRFVLPKINNSQEG